MNAKKCDRCGAFYTKKECKNSFERAISEFVKAIQLAGMAEGQRDILDEIELKFDLCPECSKSFRVWLRAKKRGCDGAEEQEVQDDPRNAKPVVLPKA